MGGDLSDRRHRKQPATLPKDFQFGDARPLAFHPDAFAMVFEGETCALCGGAASWSVVDKAWHCSKCGVRWISGLWPGSIHAARSRLALNTLDAIADTTSSWRAPHEHAAEQLKRQQRTGDETI
jgi:hypothetical protein